MLHGRDRLHVRRSWSGRRQPGLSRRGQQGVHAGHEARHGNSRGQNRRTIVRDSGDWKDGDGRESICHLLIRLSSVGGSELRGKHADVRRQVERQERVLHLRPLFFLPFI